MSVPVPPPDRDGTPGTPGIDPARWARLSPALDALLDLPEAERGARLATLRGEDPALADELARLLAQMAALESTAFLAAPARTPRRRRE